MGCGQTKIGVDATGGVAPGTPLAGTPAGSAPGTPSKVRIDRPNSKTIKVESTDSPSGRRKRSRPPLIKRDTWTGSQDSLEKGRGEHGGQGDTASLRGGSATSKASYHSSDSGFMDNGENGPNFVSEESDPARVREIEDNFREPGSIEGFDIVGKACPQRLSAKDQARLEEQRVMASLQAEGLIARPMSRAGNSVSFDLVSGGDGHAGDSLSLLPPLHRRPTRLAKLEKRKKRKKKKVPTATLR